MTAAMKRKLSYTTTDGDKIRKLSVTTCTDFEICLDVNELIPKRLISFGVYYDNNEVFLITRLRYESGILYLFLTGYNDVQFYYRTMCTIYAYKRCFHNRTPCPNNCKSYKSMVVTGLKTRECHRSNIFKIDKASCKPKEPFLLDDFCTDENRVQMQLNVYEGDYIRFENGVQVNEMGCAVGSFNNIKKVPLEQLKKSIDVIVGSYDLETYTNLNTFSNAKVDPIITISYVLKTHNDTKRYCFINTQGESYSFNDPFESDEYIDGKVVVLPFDNERDMIAAFVLLLCKSNPDDIVDYNGDKFDLPYLLQRMVELEMNQKFIVRYDLPPTEMNTLRVNTKFGYSFDNFFLKYFNHLDVYQFIKNSGDASKVENLKLDTTAAYYLKVGKVELTVREMMTLYHKKQFAKIVKYNVRDSILPMKMFYKCKMANKLYADASLLYLTRDDSTLTIWRKINLALFNRAIINTTESGTLDQYFFNKCDLSKIMHGKSAKDFYVDQDAEEEKTEEGELVDYTNLDRPRVPVSQIPQDAVALCDLRTRIKYTGGKVLSPKPGYYNITFTFDFSQLYTSIMIHHKTCLSNLFYGSDNKLYLQHNSNAITSKFLLEMSEKRASYKKEMKKYSDTSFEYQMYDTWQNAAKLVCNSQYGWFGLCCKALANFITAQGRIKLTEAEQIIRGLSDNERIKTKWNLTALGLDVIYGDTDSNFVNIQMKEEDLTRLGMDGLRQLIVEDILEPLNTTWNGAFKMELENIMQCMLIKGKKAYMCIKQNGQLYKRGFNVKKDSPLFLRQAFDDVILKLLTRHSLDCVLNGLVCTLKTKRDNFEAANCEEYSFSQTLNETKNGGDGEAVTIAYLLYMQLRNNANTKYVPSSGDRIPYLLMDKLGKNVRDKVKPTQLIVADDMLNWSKHLGIVCTFLNDIMSMVGNDSLFVYAFETVCQYYQRDQRFGVVYPTLKQLTVSRIKDILCKEMNIKDKKKLLDTQVEDTLERNEQKYIHSHEFTMTTQPPKYTHSIKGFDTNNCPVCNSSGVAAVEKKMVLNLIPPKPTEKNKSKSKIKKC
ncbi:dna-pol [Matsumuraeses phaseoli granulovirus]|uniref:DNA-directed DNA polymerase n=1 Tax=Matsumuraeses phaseoli granulovirus TaxID=2760664 RepID=A0AAE7SYS8_9BBAC|nr:dna-pol [Matsumuraeses phaseoli granulovirus]QOD40062.1 dna-pol [Matsumuraeses phaseoli granulovirus]